MIHFRRQSTYATPVPQLTLAEKLRIPPKSALKRKPPQLDPCGSAHLRAESVRICHNQWETLFVDASGCETFQSLSFRWIC